MSHPDAALRATGVRHIYLILTIAAQDLVDAPGSSVLDASHAPDAALPADINELQSAKLLRLQGEDDREGLV